jgi:hypothetical protein
MYAPAVSKERPHSEPRRLSKPPMQARIDFDDCPISARWRTLCCTLHERRRPTNSANRAARPAGIDHTREPGRVRKLKDRSAYEAARERPVTYLAPNRRSGPTSECRVSLCFNLPPHTSIAAHQTAASSAATTASAGARGRDRTKRALSAADPDNGWRSGGLARQGEP